MKEFKQREPLLKSSHWWARSQELRQSSQMLTAGSCASTLMEKHAAIPCWELKGTSGINKGNSNIILQVFDTANAFANLRPCRCQCTDVLRDGSLDSWCLEIKYWSIWSWRQKEDIFFIHFYTYSAWHNQGCVSPRVCRHFQNRKWNPEETGTCIFVGKRSKGNKHALLVHPEITDPKRKD